MDILDLLGSLSSSKVDASQKIELFQKLDTALLTSSEKEQYLIDSLSSCLDSLSGKEKLVTENESVINKLLSLFAKKIEKTTKLQRKFHLNGNIYEVLSKFMKKRDILNTYTLFDTWHSILTVEDWNKVLLSKSNILSETLQIVCTHFTQGVYEDEKQELIISLLVQLINLYIKQKKYEFNVKKLFQGFCEHLLVPLLCTRSKLQNETNNHTIIQNVDELLNMVIGHRDHLLNLKLIIEPDKMETPQKRVKYQAYFEIFFSKIRDASHQTNLIQSLPIVYKIIIQASRSSGTFKSHEEFKIMTMIFKEVKMTDIVNSVTIKSCLEFFDIVHHYDVYKRIEDKSNIHSQWMTELLRTTLGKYEASDIETRSKLLSLFCIVFSINHSSGEPFLTKIIGYCLEPSTQANKQEEVLITLLETYGNLHKLEYFLENFPLEFEGTLSVPYSFTTRYCQILTQLQTSQIIRLLEMFGRKSEVLLDEISDTNMRMLQHVTYLMFYCVVTNASVIPENLYSKPDLQKFIEIMMTLKMKFKNIKDKFLECTKSIQDKYESIHLLISIGVNEMITLLKELALYDDGDDENIEETPNDQNTHPLIRYLKVWKSMEAMKFRQVPRDQTFLNQIMQTCLSKNFTHAEWNFEIFSIDDENFWIALLHKVLENFELFLFDIEDDKLSHKAVGLLWKTLVDMENVKLKENVEKLLANKTIYNYPSFQSNSMKQIKENLQNILGTQWPQSLKLTSLENKESLSSFLKILDKIKMEYLTEEHWLSMFDILSSLFTTIKNLGNEEDITLQCVQLLDKLFQDGQTACHRTCQLTFVEFMNDLMAYSLDYWKKHGRFNDDILKLFKSFFQIFMIHVKRDVDDVTQIHQKLFTDFTKKDFQPAVAEILKSLLESLVELVQLVHTNKGRTLLSVLDFLKLVLQSVQENLDIFITSYREITFCLYSSLCIIYERLAHRKETRHKVESETESVCKFSKHISSMLQDDLQKTGKIDENCLQVISFICSKNNLATSLKTSMNFDSDMFTKILIKAQLKDVTNKLIPDIIARLISGMDSEKCMDFLQTLADELDKINRCKERQIHVIEIWKALLASKWGKEQKELLLKVLPKVILVSTNVLCCYDEDSPYINQSLVKVLSLAVSISKGSHHVTKYVSSILHIFSKPSQLLHNESFKEDFEELYQILSLMLYMHSTTFAYNIHCFIQALNNLFSALVAKTNEVIDKQNLEYCFTRISRLYGELASHKETISKFSPYFIGGYIKICSSTTISLAHKKILDDGIYMIFDSCAEEELAMMNMIFENADREHYRELRTYHEKHWKFTG